MLLTHPLPTLRRSASNKPINLPCSHHTSSAKHPPCVVCVSRATVLYGLQSLTFRRHSTHTHTHTVKCRCHSEERRGGGVASKGSVLYWSRAFWTCIRMGAALSLLANDCLLLGVAEHLENPRPSTVARCGMHTASSLVHYLYTYK